MVRIKPLAVQLDVSCFASRRAVEERVVQLLRYWGSRTPEHHYMRGLVIKAWEDYRKARRWKGPDGVKIMDAYPLAIDRLSAGESGPA